MAQPTVGAAAAITGVSTFLAHATSIRGAVLGMNTALRAGGAAGAIAGAGLTTAAAGAAAAVVPMALLVGAITLGVGALVGLTAAIVGTVTSFAIAGVKIASDFQTNIGRVGAVTHSTTEQLHALRAQVVELSLATGKSLADVSLAAFELAKGGIEITQQLGPTGALKAVTDLTIASSGELGLAQSAQAVARGIKAFGLEAGEANIVVDALVNAAQRSTSGFSDLTNAFSYLASTASTMGLTIAETAAVVGVLSNANILGSQAGTNFRQALISLIDPSKEGAKVMQQYGISIKDAEGNIRPFRDILGDLEGAFSDTAVASGKLTQAEQLRALNMIFTTRGMNAILALINQGVDAFNELAEVTLTASDVATRMLLPLAAQFNILTNAVKVASNAFGEGFIPLLSEATRGAIAFLTDGAKLQNILTAIGLTISNLIAGQGFGEVFQLLGQAGVREGGRAEAAIRAVLTVLLNMRAALVDDVLPAMGRALGAIASAFGTTTEAASELIPGDDQAAKWTEFGRLVSISIRLIYTGISIALDSIPLLIDTLELLRDAYRVIDNIVNDFYQTLAKLPSIVGEAFSAVGVLVNEVVTVIGQGFGLLGEAIAGVIADIAESRDNFNALISGPLVALGEAIGATIANMLAMRDAFHAMIGEALAPLGEAFGLLWSIVVEVVTGIINAAIGLFEGIKGVVAGIVSALGVGAEAFNVLGEASAASATDTANNMGSLADAIGTAVNGAINALAPLADAFDLLVNGVAEAGAGIAQQLSSILEGIRSFVTGAISWLNGIIDAANNVINGLRENAGALGEAFAGRALPRLAAAGGAVTVTFNRAGAAVSGFGATIRGLANSVGQSFSDLGSRTRAALGPIGERAGEIASRFGSLVDRIRSIPDALASTFTGGRGFNLDNLIQGMDRLQDSTQGAREEAERSAPAFDDLGDAAGKAAKAAEDAAEKLADAFKDVALEIAKLETDFAELERNAADKIEEIGFKFAERMVEANTEWAESTQEATQKASDAIDELNQNLADNRSMRERRDNFERELQQEADAWNRHWENIEFEEKLVMDRMNRARQRMLDDIQDRIDKQNDAAARKRDRLLEDERQKRGDALEDERDRRGREQQAELDALKAKQKAAEDLLKDKQKAESDALKATSEETDKAAEDRLKEQQENELNNLKLGQELAFNKLKEEIDNKEKLRRRAEEREERDRRRAEEEAERALREQMADGERKRNRALEDEEAKINEARDRASQALTRSMEEIEREFKARQDARRRTEEDKIEDERVTKRINEINSEKDKRIQEINLVLKKKQEKIKEDADEEVRKYKKALDERMADLRDALLDKSIKLVQEHGEAIQPAIDELFYVFDTRAERTIGLYEQLVGTLDQVLRMQAQVDTPEPIQSRSVPMSFGSVPMGPVGYGNNLSTVNYNVNANYANTQSPATVREDMQALVMLSMR